MTPDLTILILVFTPLSLFIGFGASAIGFTAWPLMVPLLFVLFGFDLYLTIFISLLVDCSNALIKTLSATRKNQIDIKSGGRLAIVACLGVIPGIYASKNFIPQNTELFRGTIGIFTLLFGLGFIRRGLKKGKEKAQDKVVTANQEEYKITTSNSWKRLSLIKVHIIWLLIAFVAFLTGLIGIGGGMLYAIFLMACLAFPTMKATGTAMMITCVSTLFAAFGIFLQIPGQDVFNQPMLVTISLIIAISMLGAITGERITFVLSERKTNLLIGSVIILGSILVTVEGLLLN